MFKTINLSSSKFEISSIGKAKNIIPILREVINFYGSSIEYERRVEIVDVEYLLKYQVIYKHKYLPEGFIFEVGNYSDYEIVYIYTNADWKHILGLINNIHYMIDSYEINLDNYDNEKDNTISSLLNELNVADANFIDELNKITLL